MHQRSVSTPTFTKIVSQCETLPISGLTIYLQLGMMIDIALGLEYLHERTPKVIHRDVSEVGFVGPWTWLLMLCV